MPASYPAAEPVFNSWKASLALDFGFESGKTVLAGKSFDGPLVVQKPFYPEGDAVCHVVVVHPPGGIAGGDQLSVNIRTNPRTGVLLTTPGAGKWYRSAGPWASQKLSFEVEGALEWLPRETIVFDGARASLECTVNLGKNASYIGWEVVCLGRSGSGERFRKGEIRLDSRIAREGKPLWIDRGRIEGGGALMRSPAGLGGHAVFGTLVATVDGLQGNMKALIAKCRESAAVTVLPGLLVARYLGDSSEEAMACLTRIWQALRPAIAGRAATAPRIWST
jgi:urease accessory protein